MLLIRRLVCLAMLWALMLFTVGCGGANNDVVAPENPVPPPKMPLKKAPSTSKTLP